MRQPSLSPSDAIYIAVNIPHASKWNFPHNVGKARYGYENQNNSGLLRRSIRRCPADRLERGRRRGAIHAGGGKPTPIIVEGGAYTASNDPQAAVVPVLEDEENVLSTGDTGFVEWKFTVREAGLYRIDIRYRPLEGKGNAIERKLGRQRR